MRAFAGAGVRVGVAAMMLFTSAVAAGAVGALAIGACGAYGHARGYRTDGQANNAALAKCQDSKCRIVATVRGQCMSFSIDAANPCGSFGIGTGVKLETAQNRALRACYRHGGKSCVTRVFACD